MLWQAGMAHPLRHLLAAAALACLFTLVPGVHPDAAAQDQVVEASAPEPEPRLADIELRGLRVPGRVHRALPNELRLQIDRGRRIRRMGLIFFGITGVAVAGSTGAFVYCLGSDRAREMFGCMVEGSMMLMTGGAGTLLSGVLMGVGRRRLTDARAQVELLVPELSLESRRVGFVLQVRR